MLHRFPGVPFALTVLVSAHLYSQSPPTIKANVPLVLIPVTVTDKKGVSIDGLSVEDFILTDDGVRQNVRMDTSDTVLAPISLVVAVQCSGISAAILAKINRVGGMIQPLVVGERGRAAVVAFDDEVRIFQDFTADSTKIRVAFEKIQPRVIRKGHLIDAVGESVRLLETRPENSRRVLLILSESRDRGSKMKLAQAIELVQRAGVTAYPATYSAQASAWTAKPEDNPPMPGGPNYLGAIGELVRMGKTNDADAFARATGGRHLSFGTLKGLEETITRAGEEIHSQYLLSFVPQETKNGGYHRIEVAVTSHPDAMIRARPGYWPSK
jgi:VWFA-related protein